MRYVVQSNDGHYLERGTPPRETRNIADAWWFSSPDDARQHAELARFRLEGHGYPKKRGWQARKF